MLKDNGVRCGKINDGGTRTGLQTYNKSACTEDTNYTEAEKAGIKCLVRF